jgi:hypothetical protein
MNDPHSEENHEHLRWLTVGLALDGMTCVYCGREWKSREDVIQSDPVIVAKDLTKGTFAYACRVCWKRRGFGPVSAE